MGTHGTECDRQRDFTPIQVGDIEHECDPGVFVNEAQLWQGANSGDSDRGCRLDGGSRMVDSLIR